MGKRYTSASSSDEIWKWEKLLQTYYQLGGDINVSSPKDRNGLLHDETILLKLPKVMKILDFGGDCNVPNSDGLTAFHVVISQKFPIQQKLVLIKEFLKHGLPCLDNTLDVGSSVLGYAISSNQLEIVKLLVEADETCKTFLDSYNLSCLSHAIFKNCHIDIICYLLKSGWEPNGFKYDDATHFSGAITSDRLDIVDALLRHPDIDPNFGGKFVPLTVALRHRHIQKLPMIKNC